MKFANFEALKRVTGETPRTKNNQLLIYRLAAVFVLILSVSGPVIWYTTNVNFNDYVIAIDASASMSSEDIYPDRLRAAKFSALEFIDTLNSKTQVGVVSFAGVSYVEAMLTNDLYRVKRAINKMDIIPAGGTDIGAALINSANVLLIGRKAKKIILLTDGSDTAGFAVDDNVEAGIDYVRSNHITVYTIGIGTDEGDSGALPSEIHLTFTYNKGQLQKVAEATGGKFFEATNQDELAAAFEEIANESDKGKVSLEIRFGLVVVGLILLFVEWGLVNVKFRAFP